MKSVLLLLVCWSFVGQTTAEELPKKVLDFLCYTIGDINNRAQVDLKGSDYDLIEARVRRVHVPFLEPNVTLFMEQATNGGMQFFQLGVLTDGPNNTLSMKLYYFTDFSDFKFGTYDLDKLSQVKPEDLQSDDDCVASFQIWGKGLMTAVFPNCRYTNNGTHPYLIITYTCDLYTVMYPPNTGQRFARAPYVLQFKSLGKPLTDAPKGYISPCNP